MAKKKVTRAERIRQAILASRSDWLDYTVTQEREIFDLFKASAENIIQQLQWYETKGVIPPARLNYLLDNVVEEMKILRPKIALTFERGIRESVHRGIEAGHRVAEVAVAEGRKFKIGIGTSYIDQDGIVRKYNNVVERYADSVWATVHTAAVDAVMRIRPGGFTFAESVWDITYQSQRSIRRAINVAVVTGRSASAVSRDIRGFLEEPRKLFRRVRDRKGVLRLSRAAQVYHPGTGVYRSSFKNAMRVARTELNRAFREGQIRYAMKKPWIKEIVWHIGGPDPCEICEDLDGNAFPVDEVPDIPHPHCMCWLETVVTGSK